MIRFFLFCLCLLPVFVSAAEQMQQGELDSISGRAAQSRSLPPPQEAPPGGDFTLRSASGPVSLKDFRGKVVLLFFGYASCPDVCPTELANMAKVLNALNEVERAKVRGIFVSVDPKRDTPELLADYVAYFHPNIVGVMGTEEQVAKVAELYGAQYYEVKLEGSAMDYAVNHSAVTYLVTPDGTLRFVFPQGTPPDIVLQAVRYVLAGK